MATYVHRKWERTALTEGMREESINRRHSNDVLKSTQHFKVGKKKKELQAEAAKC